MSLTMITSPNSKTGTSTIANYIALGIAKKTKQLTLLIEFSRYTGRTIYMQKQCSEKRRSLKNVVMNPKDFTILKENIMRSMNNGNMYFLSMNLYEDFLEMKSYASTSLTRIIDNAKDYFKHIVIDLPSNMEEPVVGAALSNNFGHKIDNIFMVLDEDVLTFKMLYDYSAILRLGNAEAKEVTYIVNKVTNHYVDFIDNHLELPLIKPLNLVKLLYVPDMLDCCNRGTPDRIGTNKNAKEFKSGIEELCRIALSPEKISGVGMKGVKTTADRKEKTKGKIWKNKTPKQPKPPKQPKRSKNKRSSKQDTIPVSEELFFEEQPNYQSDMQETDLTSSQSPTFNQSFDQQEASAVSFFEEQPYKQANDQTNQSESVLPEVNHKLNFERKIQDSEFISGEKDINLSELNSSLLSEINSLDDDVNFGMFSSTTNNNVSEVQAAQDLIYDEDLDEGAFFGNFNVSANINNTEPNTDSISFSTSAESDFDDDLG